MGIVPLPGMRYLIFVTAVSWASSMHAQSPASLLHNRFEIDQQHSSVIFTSRILGAVKVRGRFNQFGGSLIFDAARPERSSVTAIILSQSIDTDMSFRDGHLRSPDFFDTDQFPTIEFRSDRLERRSGALRMLGTLTMHGVSKPIALPLTQTLKPDTVAASGLVRVAFDTHVVLSRADFGIAGTNKFNPSYNPLSTMLGDSIDVDISVYAIKLGYRDRTFAGSTPPSVADTVSRVLAARGASAAAEVYAQLRSGDSTAFNFSAGQLNALGRQLMERGKYSDAVTVLEINDRAFPKTGGVATSLGDALVMAGDLPRAASAYKRALAVNPNDAAAAEMLRRLRPLAG